MKEWLSEHGLETDSLDKKAVAELLKTAPPKLAKVLELRQQLAKSSVKKYQAMQNAVCKDGRARGLFQFYGGNRTGRFSGRLIQLQNLPQNHISDLKEAREIVKNGDFECMNMLYDNIPDILSQLIRTALVPKKGYKFIYNGTYKIDNTIAGGCGIMSL
jgi:DNA polymerase